MRIIVGFQAAEGEAPSTRRLRVAGLYTQEEAGGRRHHLLIEEDEEEDPLPEGTRDDMGECSLAIIDHGLTRLFYWLGHKIGQNPSYYLIIPFFISLLFGTGLQRLR